MIKAVFALYGLLSYSENGRKSPRWAIRVLGSQTCGTFAALTKGIADVKILVVDDHVLIREALRGVFQELEKDLTILEAAGGGEATRIIEANADLDLIVLDLNLPDCDGFGLLEKLSEHYKALPVVVMSAQHDRASVVRALDLGVMGFIPKAGQRQVMLNALRLILDGGVYIPPEILNRDEPAAARPAETQATRLPAGTKPEDVGLTARQIDVLALIMEGMSNKAICRVLDLAEPTVKNHVTAILKALEVSNRVEAVIAAREMNWKLPKVPKS